MWFLSFDALKKNLPKLFILPLFIAFYGKKKINANHRYLC
jgi:hypothetical protein